MTRIRGSYGNDEIVGTTGNDVIDGLYGADTITGGDGNDVITDTGGAATLDGGAGDDVITYRNESDGYSVFRLDPSDITINGGMGNDLVTVSLFRSTATIDLGAGDDVLQILTLPEHTTMTLGAGHDVVVLALSALLIEDAIAPTITDFSVGDGGDALDLSQIIRLQRFVPNYVIADNPFASGTLRLVQDGSDTIVRFDVDGDGPGMGEGYEVTIIRLANVDLNALTAFNFGGWSPAGGDPIVTAQSGTAGNDLLAAHASGGQIDGLGGDDTLLGSAGPDVLIGGAGNDKLDGSYGDDWLQGGDGNDILTDVYGNDRFDGGAGDDQILIDRPSGPGDPNKELGPVTLVIDAGSGNDFVRIDATNSDYYPSSIGIYGSYTATLGDGDDIIHISTHSLAGTITLGAGHDRVELDREYFFDHIDFAPPIVITDFETGDNGDILDMAELLAQALFPQTGNAFETGHLRLVQQGNATIVGFDYDGIDHDDQVMPLFLLQGVQPSQLTAYNLGGQDPGFAAAVSVTLTGTAGADRLVGLSGADTLNGLGGDDRLIGATGDDLLVGGLGNDFLSGGGGTDHLIGGDGDDRLEDLDEGSDTLEGGDGNDIIVVDHVYAYEGYETISILAGAGNDDVSFNSYRPGQVSIDLGAGTDRLDLQYLLEGGTTVTTGAGGDLIIINPINAAQSRGELVITDFTAGAGGDRLDWLAFSRAKEFLAIDVNPFAAGLASLTQEGADTIFRIGNGQYGTVVVRLQGVTLGNLVAENFGGVDISLKPPVFTHSGTSGNDVINGSASDDRIQGKTGNDTIHGLGGADYILGQDGDDIIDGGAGNDQLDGGIGIDAVSGGDGNDLITDTDGADTIDGGAGDDVINVDMVNRYILDPEAPVGSANGGDGNDDFTILDDAGGYSVNGGAGDDTVHLRATVGDFSITLGSGVDTIEQQRLPLNGGKVTVTDFQTGPGGDVVLLDKLFESFLQFELFDLSLIPQLNMFQAGYAYLKQVGPNVELWLSKDRSPDSYSSYRAMVFANTTKASFTADNFGGQDPQAARVGPITVTGAYQVGVGTHVDLVNPLPELGLTYFKVKGLFDLAINGSIAVHQPGLAPVTGLVAGSTSNSDGSKITIGSLGNLTLENSSFFEGRSSGAVGIDTSGSQIKFLNNGTLRVETLSGSATGLVAGANPLEVPANGSSNINNGAIFVSAHEDAIGIRSIYGEFQNNGTLTVESDIFAIGIYAPFFVRGIVNNGTIHVSTDASSPYASVGILINQGYQDTGFVHVNTGTISADYAYYFRETSPSSRFADVIQNSGRIEGAILLNDGNDVIHNSGIIFGRTMMGRGDDLYDGALGSHGGIVEGEQGNDRLIGGDAADTFYGDIGSDLLIGNGGDDILEGGYGNDLLDGGDGIDVISYYESPNAVWLDLAGGIAYAGPEIDYLRNFEDAYGSRGNDVLLGSEAGNLLLGVSGDDQLYGLGGDDILLGGTGNDWISSGSGADRILFAAGDGADTIADFTAADALEIYGYAAAQSITQVGSDVLVTLSGSDSILVLGSSVALVSAGIVFSLSPLPIAEPLNYDTTLKVSTDFVLGAGQQYALSDTDPFLIRPLADDPYQQRIGLQFDGALAPVAFWNSGTLSLHTVLEGAVATGVGWRIDGVNTDHGVYNLVGGMIDVRAEASAAYGIYAIEKVQNFGTIQVVSLVDSAFGVVDLNSDSAFVNAGDIVVEGVGEAGGVIQQGNSSGPVLYLNSGNVSVHGTEASHGFLTHMSAHPLAEQPNFVNSGTITVTDETDQRDSVGIGIGLGAKAQIWNSGSITADYAIKFERYFSFSPVLDYGLSVYNSGQLNGAVVLSSYHDLLLNTATIAGDVFMGGGDDVFDGRLGILSGVLDGYDGNDTLLAGAGDQKIFGGFGDDILSGGAGADSLTGGPGADHFRFGQGFGIDTIMDFKAGEGDSIDVATYATYQSLAQVGADVVITFSAKDKIQVLNTTVAAVSGALHLDAPGIANHTIPAAPAAPVTPDAPDSVAAAVYVLPDMMGTAAADSLYGSGTRDVMYGLAGDDRLFGNAGNDMLDGGTGADWLYGGLGDDSYAVDTQGDLVFEGLDEGYDSVTSTVGFYLYANIEKLTLLPGSGDIFGVGNELDNLMFGNEGQNLIIGWDGADEIHGGAARDARSASKATTSSMAMPEWTISSPVPATTPSMAARMPTRSTARTATTSSMAVPASIPTSSSAEPAMTSSTAIPAWAIMTCSTAMRATTSSMSIRPPTWCSSSPAKVMTRWWPASPVRASISTRTSRIWSSPAPRPSVSATSSTTA